MKNLLRIAIIFLNQYVINAVTTIGYAQTTVNYSVPFKAYQKRQGTRCPRASWNSESVDGECTDRMCRFTCKPGFFSRDNIDFSTMVCNANGQWEGSIPVCIRGCTALGNPTNGQATGSCTGAITGEVCRFSCNFGYQLSSSATLTCTCLQPCTQAVWSNSPPSCIAVQCPPLTISTGGTTQGSCTRGLPNDVCTFSCLPGYYLSGTATLTCQSGGTWSAPAPQCLIRGCLSLVPPPNGITSGNCANASPGSTCTITCNPGFTLTGPSTLTCNADGTWTSPTPSCGARLCSPLIPPLNGGLSASCSNPTAGSTCTVICNSGYTLIGSPTVTCLASGTWDRPTPSCSRQTCPALIGPVGGQATGECNPGYIGGVCSFSCFGDYRLVGGPPTITCQSNGDWSDTSPTCQRRICPGQAPPANGENAGACNPGFVGQTCTYVCNAGFRLAGPPTITCLDSEYWSGSPPVCSRISCEGLAPPANGAYNGACNPGLATASCIFTCNEGYGPIGAIELICQDDGLWSAHPAICLQNQELTCAEELAIPENGEATGDCSPGIPGQTCTFTCNEGYTIEGVDTVTCMDDGTWDSDAPVCVEDEGETTPGEETTTTGGQEDTTTTEEEETTTVSEGSPSPSPSPSPAPGGRCKQLIRPPNGRIVSCNRNVGGRCVVQCNAYYIIYGPPVRTCQRNKRWTGTAPTCIRRTFVRPG